MKEILIKMSDEVFKYLNKRIELSAATEIDKIVWNGKVLPEGHDRLIDAKVAQSHLYNNMNWFDKDGYIADDEEKDKALQDLVDGIPSVVDADKE